MKLLLRVVGVFSFLIVFVSLTTTPAQAQSNPYLTPNTDPNVAKDMNTFTQSIVLSSLNSVSCMISGVDFLSPNHQCLGLNPQTGKLGYTKESKGLISVASKLIAATYTPITSSQESARYLSNSFITNKNQAYAQEAGIGYRGLSPIASVWSVFRNLTYLFFTVIFVLIGIGIMLRTKLNAKAEMTVQNSLPRIVIGMLLVTFSFAIAGLMIDLMFVLTYIILNIMQQADSNMPNIVPSLNMPPGGVIDELFKGNFFGIPVTGIFNLVGNAASAATQFVSQSLEQLFKANSILSFIIGVFNVACWGPKVISLTPSNPDWAACAAQAFEPIIIVILWLIFYIAIIIALIRLWFFLLKCYILIVIDVTLSPLLIALGLIPGAPYGFGTWMRGITANLLVFPACVFLFALAKVYSDNLSVTTDIFVPPMVGNALGTDGQPSLIGYLVAFGMVIVAPTLLDNLKDSLKAPKPQYGVPLAATLAAGGALAAASARGAGKAMWYHGSPVEKAVLGPTGPVRPGGRMTRRRELAQSIGRAFRRDYKMVKK